MADEIQSGSAPQFSAPTATSTPEFSQPAPAPMPAPTPAPVVMPATPTYAAPTSTAPANGTWDFVKSVNWIEVTFMFLAATALMYTIKYYRFKLKEDKTANKDIQRRIDKVEAKTIQLETAQIQQQAPTQQTVPQMSSFSGM